MWKSQSIAKIVILSFFISATSAFAAPRTYQVTGPLVELSDSKIVIQKGKDKWEIERTSHTKLPEGVKIGSKVTIEYTMAASTVSPKIPGAGKAGKKEAAHKAQVAK